MLENIRSFIDYYESRNCSQNNYEILYPVSLHMFNFDTWFAEQCPTNGNSEAMRTEKNRPSISFK